MEAAPADGDECTRRVIAASTAEATAIECDRAGNVAEAIRKYELCERELAAAIAAAMPAHAEDHPKLVTHRNEVLARLDHLKSLKGGPSTIPVEDQIKAVQLGMQATTAAQNASSAAGGVKVLAATAGLGALGGFVILGGTIGLTASVVGGAAVGAYCATRSDKVGDAARKTGEVAVAGADRARALNEEHKITEKAAAAASAGVEKAKQVNERYGISDKISKGVSAAASKAQEIEDKHKLTDKAAAGVSRGLSMVSGAIGRVSASAPSSGAAPSAAPAAGPP